MEWKGFLLLLCLNLYVYGGEVNPKWRYQFTKEEKLVENSLKVDVKKIYGKIRVVTIGEDYKVRVVNIGEDLRVRKVDIAANKVGLWQEVNIGEDFKIKFVTIGEDFKIRYVNIGEGVRE